MRVGVVGYPGDGKTSFALTFPKPLVIDYDNKLPKGVQSFPFWNPVWVKEKFPKQDHSKIVNIRDAIMEFHRDWLPKLPKDCTLIEDSWTQIMTNFFIAAKAYPDSYMTKEYTGRDGKYHPATFDGFKLYKHLIDYASELLHYLKGWPYHSVTTFHLQVRRDDKGNAIPDTCRPAMEGQYADRIAGDFTYFLRVWKNPRTLDFRLLTVNSQLTAVLPPGVSPAPGDGMIPATYEALCKLPRRS